MIIVANKIEILKKEITVVPLGNIVEITVGLQTGDNNYYLFKENSIQGSYKNIDKRKLLSHDELENIISNKEIRTRISQRGISKKMFNGKTTVPYDKGGSSDIESKRLSNYYSPTQFYIDWSEENVKRIKELTIAERKKFYGDTDIKKTDGIKIASRFQNVEYYFKRGITISIRGIYSPTFRLSSGGIFDVMGSCAFSFVLTNEYLLGILCSKLAKYITKCYLNNTVAIEIEELKKFPLAVNNNNLAKKIEIVVKKIITNQKKDKNYDYSKEQKILDELNYELYGLDRTIIEEVEDWYDRKYPKLQT